MTCSSYVVVKACHLKLVTMAANVQVLLLLKTLIGPLLDFLFTPVDLCINLVRIS